ncbi:EboA domain-containing protein [Streptomyces tsukubensis]|uniref:Sugar phosphate isomerase n=1 Tax=Streptomyces tsukubensis (strain DSM 42081 / NBRC 108919 / NRRL 18488 / 9993) TaxID=1114943 RepID=A0A7G3U8E0_STRT9|nr:EboA domain-containing protein [Streptomyces tsukubensis]AZK97463.1 sugar phosphate isomerase [Streptomyces tsukubensis]QKM66587.1 sugar phosphate isomerase [Streptomyces tsukubensis NRRL18488]TAI45070.1 sugar phosphate isomerase [Streptomyces tsukubensis]
MLRSHQNQGQQEAALAAALDTTAGTWLKTALARARSAAAAVPATAPDSAPGRRPRPVASWELAFSAAGRHLGPENADTGRVLLLLAAAADLPTLTRLYHRGTADERRAVLLALPRLDPPEPATALPLVEDALRTNDTRLVAAALGPYAAAHLTPHAWRHAVLKCLFTGVPLAAVDGLARRAHGDAELARMLDDYAAERTAAGRPVPPDLTHALALTGVAVPSKEV